MSAPIWMDPAAMVSSRIASLRAELHAKTSAPVAHLLSSAEAEGMLAVFLRRVLGKRTMFSISDRKVLVEVMLRAVTDETHIAALGSAALLAPGGWHNKETAQAQLMKVWIKAEIKAQRPPPEERRKVAIEAVVRRRANRAVAYLSAAQAQKFRAEKAIKKWEPKVKRYLREGAFEAGYDEDRARTLLGED